MNYAMQPRSDMEGQDVAGWPVVPPANIYAREDEYLVELEMPGVTRETLEISIEANELTVRGRPNDAQAPGKLIYSETNGRHFQRSFELSNDVDSARIRGDLHQGVLCLHLPKAKQAKPRKIKVD